MFHRPREVGFRAVRRSMPLVVTPAAGKKRPARFVGRCHWW